MSAMEDEASTSTDYTDIPSTSTSREPSHLQTATDTDRDSFYFESDHVALKGNSDYQKLFKTMLLLESQRSKAIKDLAILQQKKQEALADPIAFVKKLQNKEDLGLPTPPQVPDLPDIDWEKYTSNLNPMNWKHKHVTRHKRSSIEFQAALTKPIKIEPELSSGGNSDDDKFTVRGRVPVNELTLKTKTFNKLWTPEEQKKLEDLLIKFPPESVEMRRWEKIARELGNRTPHQVQSRTQKYFIKLAKLGLPIPGRMPNVGPGRGKLHRHQRHNRLYFQPSTFLTSYEPPLYMSDDEGDGFQTFGSRRRNLGSQGQQIQPYEDISDEDDVPLELRNTEEYRQILELKRLKCRRLKEEIVEHVGYKCDHCECEPIVGTRWHCQDCPEDVAVDFCDECADIEYKNEHHKASHNLQAVKVAEGSIKTERDTDYSYTTNMPGGYNYLDPNYMPAS